MSRISDDDDMFAVASRTRNNRASASSAASAPQVGGGGDDSDGVEKSHKKRSRKNVTSKNDDNGNDDDVDRNNGGNSVVPSKKKGRAASHNDPRDGPSALVQYLSVVGGASMNLDEVPRTIDGRRDEATMLRVVAAVESWQARFKPERKPLPSRKVRGFRVLVNNYDVTDMTMHATTAAPMRLMIRNIDVKFPSWAAKRAELFQFTLSAAGDLFGDHVSLNKTTPQRRSIPLTMEALYGVVPDWQKEDGSFVPVSLDDEVQRNILPYLEAAARNAPFCLLKASIFVDPPGSVSQTFHEDVPECDRVQLWNLFLPIQIAPGVQSALMERNELAGITRPIPGENDAIMWDGHWLHKGVGNTSTVTRVYLHLVYAQVWVTQSPKGIPALSAEYNRKQPLDDIESPVGYWLDHYMQGAPLL